jgi:hypothetical protein
MAAEQSRNTQSKFTSFILWQNKLT